MWTPLQQTWPILVNISVHGSLCRGRSLCGTAIFNGNITRYLTLKKGILHPQRWHLINSLDVFIVKTIRLNVVFCSFTDHPFYKCSAQATPFQTTKRCIRCHSSIHSDCRNEVRCMLIYVFSLDTKQWIAKTKNYLQIENNLGITFTR